MSHEENTHYRYFSDAPQRYAGYYVSLDIEDPQYMIFIKQPPLKFRFESLYTSDVENKSLDDLGGR